MKILVICQYYWPEPFRITDICEALAERGHEVTVVTGTPNYPMGEIYPGYENGNKCDEVIHGVTVHRCAISPRKTGTINRLKNYFSFPIASERYVKTLPDDFDVVFVNQLSPVMMAEAGIWYKKRHGKKMILYCLDLWPESLCIGGVRRNSLIYRAFKKISKRIYRSADEILVTSRSFQPYLSKMFGIAEEKIHYLPQYAESQFLELPSKPQGEIFELLFAGNIGAAQSVDTILDAAELLQDEKVRFHIVGDGIELERLKKRAANLKNVIFYGRKPLEDMPQYYAMADAMLVTLIDDPVISLTLPGKVQSYMAAGKPIIGAINGETAFVLNEAQGGYCGKAEDGKQLASNIRKVMQTNDLNIIGLQNKAYYFNHFSIESFLRILIELLKLNSVCTYEG